MIDINHLEKAYKTLLTCYEDYINNQSSIFLDYIADACVKRFEYTLETAWKLVKKILIQKYAKTEVDLTMNNIFRYMEGYGFTDDWQKWRDYYQKRNDTSHEYNIEKSRILIELVPEFIKDVDFLINSLRRDLHND